MFEERNHTESLGKKISQVSVCGNMNQNKSARVQQFTHEMKSHIDVFHACVVLSIVPNGINAGLIVAVNCGGEYGEI